MKSISTIAAELRKSNPEIGNNTAQDLNNMLLMKGLICIVPQGKRPTKAGREKGIRKRVIRDELGRRIFYPVYTEQGERYVKALAVAYFAPNTAPVIDAFQPVRPSAIATDAPQFRFTHKDYDIVQKLNQDRLIILEGPNAFWTYFHDAKTISQIMNWSAYENRRSIPGISFSKEQLKTVLQRLNQNQISWIVVSPSEERRSTTVSTKAFDTQEESGCVEIGSNIRVCINGILEKNFCIIESDNAHTVACVSSNGMVVDMDVPELADGCISIESPAGQALLGRHIGETVSVSVGGDNNTFRILKIK